MKKERGMDIERTFLYLLRKKDNCEKNKPYSWIFKIIESTDCFQKANVKKQNLTSSEICDPKVTHVPEQGTGKRELV